MRATSWWRGETEMRSCAKSGSPVALLSQGSVTDLEREDIISPIFSSPFCISAYARGTLSFTHRPFPQGQFSFMSLLAFQSIFCCYLLFWSLSLCRLTHWIHSCFWYYPSWMTFSNQFNVSRVQHGSLTSIIFKLTVIFWYTYKNKPDGRVGCFQWCRRPTCFFRIRTTLHIRFKTSLWKSLHFPVRLSPSVICSWHKHQTFSFVAVLKIHHANKLQASIQTDIFTAVLAVLSGLLLSSTCLSQWQC